MKIFLEVLRTDFQILLRGRVGMFWTLAFPALMLVLQMTLFGSAPSLGPVELVVVTPEHSQAGKQYADFLIDALGRQQSLNALVGCMRGLLTGQPDYFTLGYTALLLSAMTVIALASAFRSAKWHART